MNLPLYPIRISVRALIEREGKVLLVKFADEYGPHYNWPGGGMEWGETVQEALVREVFEETCVEVIPGELFCLFEYLPRADMPYASPCQTVSLIFHCSLPPKANPCLPEKPDPYQLGVAWIAIDDLENQWVLPELTQEVKAWWRGDKKGIPMVVKRAE